MKKIVILILGTPSVGKTTIAQELTKELNANYINLNSLAHNYNLIQGYDKYRKTAIIDEKKMQKKIEKIIKTTKINYIIIDGHYAASVVPKEVVKITFVLRRNPIELKKIMKKLQYNENKLSENLEAEILDVCLIEALSEQEEDRICEINVSSKTTKEVTNLMLDILSNKKNCTIGKVDWIKLLESKGILNEFLTK